MSDDVLNGRITLRDLYTTVSRVEGKVDGISDRVDRISERLRAVELDMGSEKARDGAERVMLAEQRQMRTEQAVGRRWQIGTAIGVGAIIISLVANIIVALYT